MSARADPYVGLAPYGERDAEWFFGREREIELIVANLRASRLTLLYGESGVGKSSVLLAGVMPHLRRIQDADRALAAATEARGHLALVDPPSLAVAMLRDWREAPLPRLAAAIHTAVVEASGDTAIEPWDGEEPLADRLREYTRRVRTILVVLDQFEEYFTYHQDDDDPGTLAGELPDLLDEGDLRVNVLLGLREDALSRLDRFKGRIPDLFGNYLRLDYLEREAARTAIQEPVRHFNETVRAGRDPVHVHPALVEQVLDGVQAGRLALHAPADLGPRHAATTRVETPFLQLVMRQLWATGTAGGGLELTAGTLDRLGGAAAIVSNHLGQALGRLSGEDQALAADVFDFLVTPSRTKIAHTAEDLAGWAQRPVADVSRVLRELAASDRWILRVVPASSAVDRERYELYHDVRAAAVHEWSARNQDRRRVLEARRVRRRLRRRRLALALAWTSGIAVAVGGFAVMTGGEDAERSRRVTAAQLAESAKAALDSDPERSVLLALEAYKRDRSSPAAKAALRDAVPESRLRAAFPSRGAPSVCRFGCSPPAPNDEPKLPAVSLRVEPSGASFYGFEDPRTFAGDDSSLAVSPSGETVAIVRRGRVELWTPATGLVRRVAGARHVQRLAFIGAHGRLLLITRRREVLVADARSAQRTHRFTGAALVAASTGGRYVATAHRGGVVRVRDLRTGDVTRREPGRIVTSLAFDPTDSGRLAVGVQGPRPPARGQGVSLVDWQSGETEHIRARRRFIGPSEATFRSDGRLILVTAPGDHPRLYGADSLEPVAGGTKDLDSDVRWLGSRLMSVTGNVVNLRSWGLTTALGGHQYPIRDVAAGPGGLVATGADDGTARIWDAASGNQILELRVAADDAVTDVAFTPSGRFLVTATEDGTVRLWDVATGSPLAGGRTEDVAFHGTESVVGIDGAGRLVTWSAFDGSRRRTGRRVVPDPNYVRIAPQAGKVGFLSFFGRRGLTIKSIHGAPERQTFRISTYVLSGDGTRLVLLIDQPRLVNLTDDDERVPLGRPRSHLAFEGAISADNRKVFIAGRRPEIFDVGSPDRPVRIEAESRSDELRGAFDPRGERLVTTGVDAVVWDTASGEPALKKKLRAHRGPVTSVAYSPDGDRIITGGADRTVRLWDARTGKPEGVVNGFRGAVTKAELDPTGRYLLVETDFDGARVLSCTACLSAEDLSERARRYVTRELTTEERRDAGLIP